MKSLLTGLLFATLAWLPGAHAAETPVAGQDYVEIDAGRWESKPGRIEVVEVFGYTCPHCAHLEPLLREWKGRQGKDVSLVPVPAAFGGRWDIWARAYFAAEHLGVAARTHQAVFDALHVSGSLPGNPSAHELTTFYASQGVDPDRFRQALAAPEVEARMQRSASYVRAAGLQGTPSLIVNGRYRVQAATFEDMLRITSWLVERERASARAKAAATSR